MFILAHISQERWALWNPGDLLWMRTMEGGDQSERRCNSERSEGKFTFVFLISGSKRSFPRANLEAWLDAGTNYHHNNTNYNNMYYL